MRVFTYGEKILTGTCTPVETIDDELRAILDEMFPFMQANRGVGLAAPQIGIPKRFFVMNAKDKSRKVINPEILSHGNAAKEELEGCLSVPGIHKKVSRPRRITVRYLNEYGETFEEELKDYPARVFQHEFDHLEGILFTDRVSPLAKKLIARDLEQLAKTVSPEE
jgi:peptide deformylase